MSGGNAVDEVISSTEQLTLNSISPYFVLNALIIDLVVTPVIDFTRLLVMMDAYTRKNNSPRPQNGSEASPVEVVGTLFFAVLNPTSEFNQGRPAGLKAT